MFGCLGFGGRGAARFCESRYELAVGETTLSLLITFSRFWLIPVDFD